MGIRLITEILDHAPPDLTSTERLVLLVIAEEANDRTRTGWPPLEAIADRAGLSVGRTKKVIQSLAARGHEIRVSFGTGRDGRPVFAYRGRQVNYVIPAFPLRHGAGAERRASRTTLSDVRGGQADHPSDAKGVSNLTTLPRERVVEDDHPSERKGGRSRPERVVEVDPKGWSKSTTPSPQSPQTISSSSSARTNEQSPDDDDGMDDRNEDAKAVAEVARRIGVSPERAQKIADEIRHRFEPRNITAYLAKMSSEKLRELEADIGQDNGNGEDIPHYFRKPALKDCPKCDRPFRPAENYQTHCNDCTNAMLAARMAKSDAAKAAKRAEVDR